MKKAVLGFVLIMAIFSIGSYVIGGNMKSNEMSLDEKQRLLRREYQLLTSVLNDIEHEEFAKAAGKIEAVQYIGLQSNFMDNPNGFINYCLIQLESHNTTQLKIVLREVIKILEPGSKLEASSDIVHATLEQWNIFLREYPL